MEIKLGGNTKCCGLVSKNDYQELSKYKWYLRKDGYVQGTINNKPMLMHIYLLKPMNDFVIDHINNNKLDNRRENLRIVTIQQNAENKTISKSKKSSIYRGVFYNNARKKYRAICTHNSKTINIGYFINEIDAAECRDMYIVHNNLEHMKLNFPEKKEIYLSKLFIKPCGQTNKYNYKGIIKKTNKYISCIVVNCKRICVYSSENPLECAKAYDKYIVDNNIPSKQLNFPQDHPNYNPNCIIKTVYREIDNKTIEINNNIIIDKEDYDKIKNFKIHISNYGYPIITIPRFGKTKKSYILSRFLMNCTDLKKFVDHIDSNRLNNTKKNLRFATPQQNAQNRSKNRNSSSKFIGVNKQEKTYNCNIKKNNFVIFSGFNINEEIVARYRDAYIMEYLKDDYYKLNFIWDDKNEIILWKNILNLYISHQKKTNKINKLYKSLIK